MKLKLLNVFLLFYGSLIGQTNGIEQYIGVITDTVKCQAIPEQSFALYLPSAYDPDKSWPIFYIFEPGGRGSLPVGIFKKAAEELGYIIVASNNSRNGNWELVFDAADAMLVDTQTRFNVDLNRIYTSGFSGGSRAAVAFSTLTGSVKGIIGCGAANANRIDLSIRKRNNLFYVGIVGNKDMNYLEHQLFEEHLNQLDITNIRLITADRHQWPNEDMILLACYWLELKTNPHLSSALKQHIYQAFMAHVKNQKDNLPEVLRLHKYLERDFNTSPADSLEQYSKSKEFQKLEKRIVKVEKSELAAVKYHRQAFREIPITRLLPSDSTKGISWWKVQIKKWQKKSLSEDLIVSNSAHRILNQIWAMCAQNCFQEMENGDLDLALLYNEIWLITEPENTWGQWTRATILAQQNKEDEAIEMLVKVAKSGHVSLDTISKNKHLQALMDHPSFHLVQNQLNEEGNN